MKRAFILSTGLAALLSVTAACSKGGGNATSADASTQTPNSGPAAPVASPVDKAQDAAAAGVGMAAAALPTDAQGFLTAAATSDMYEIKAAKVAEERSTSPGVKAFAAKMIHDHTATTHDVKVILAKRPSGLTPPADVDARRAGMLDNLKSATADGFDKTYLDQQVAAHTEAKNLMKGYGEHGDNPDLKAFASKTAPKVQAHLDMVKALDDEAQASPAKTPG